jgi:hypothetical protein
MQGGPVRGPAGDVGPYSPAIAAVAANAATFGPMALGIALMAAGGAEQDEGVFFGGVAVTATASVFGPSVGHWYAGEGGRGAISMALRFVTFGGSVGLVVAGFATEDLAPAVVLATFGGIFGGAGLGLMVWDLADAPDAARRANREAESGSKDARIPAITIGAHGIGPEWRF